MGCGSKESECVGRVYATSLGPYTKGHAHMLEIKGAVKRQHRVIPSLIPRPLAAWERG